MVSQGGLLLPGPEYSSEAQFADIRAAYETYAASLLRAIGWPEPELRAREIVAFESRIAAASWSHEQLRDSVRTYNPITVTELRALAPAFDWPAFLRGAGLAGVERVVIDAKSAFPGIAAAFAATPLETLRARLAFSLADARALYAGKALNGPRLVFRGQAMGNNFFSATDRSVLAERATEISLSDLVGALYVARYSSPAAKRVAETMAQQLRQAFDARLTHSPWLSPVGRARAREKLAKLSIHVGYPDRFDAYDGLEVRADDLYGNVARAAAYEWRRKIAELGKPYDRSRWILAAEYPNYNYVATTNTVEIPAALLQPPFFDLRADPAVNYGSLGALIGQMIVSGFTAQGLPYDGDGRLRPWLPADDAARFAALAARISARYSAIAPLPGLHLKGELLVDEAAGDLGGLQIALDAYHGALAGRVAPVLDGTSGDQRFFLGRAQMWRAKFPDNFVRNQIATGANAPPWVRVNAPLPWIDAWYAAFGVNSGDRMYVAPADRIRLW
jgi:putative endopeptidase